MRKWFVPMTVLGLAGLGALILSPRGRRALARLVEALSAMPQAFLGWDEKTQRDLERLRAAVDQLSDSLRAAF
jgi:hypothetical protein